MLLIATVMSPGTLTTYLISDANRVMAQDLDSYGSEATGASVGLSESSNDLFLFFSTFGPYVRKFHTPLWAPKLKRLF